MSRTLEIAHDRMIASLADNLDATLHESDFYTAKASDLMAKLNCSKETLMEAANRLARRGWLEICFHPEGTEFSLTDPEE